ncbi:hypothetical protein QC763_602240 [Podospora pseudopauciseta]|uniref:FAD dependent oxidoreductase domain-containing protein n=1 Tax=Podospora pseudopauciseta TaxID=2093780 RepID=A0ABR0H4C4_9PEZI|nr:hypothetical protein QC763_602240 [Podospora pseudopauciseta]
MPRTIYTEDSMADLAKDAMKLWDKLEKDSGSSLRWMSGLLNFGDKNFGGDSPEGTLMVTAKDIEERYPFKNLPPEWIGLFAPDNGVINVQLLLRSLLSLAKDYGAEAKQHTRVERIIPSTTDKTIWEVHAIRHDTDPALFKAKIVIASGAYVNHVLRPSFGISLDLDIWEMVASYFNTTPGLNSTIFPSMWFQFAPNKHRRSQLFYGFPTDPSERLTNVVNPADIRDTQEFIKKHVIGVNTTVPAFTLSCLQTNVFDNMFVLDYLPKEYLAGGAEKSVVVFTAGWAMKFVPLLGKALAEMALDRKSDYARKEFEITRKDKKGKGIIKRVVRGKRGGHSRMMVELDVDDEVEGESAFTYEEQASGLRSGGVKMSVIGNIYVDLSMSDSKQPRPFQALRYHP